MMQAERWKQIEELYQAALAQPAEKRAAFLVQACPDDPQLRGEVQSLPPNHCICLVNRTPDLRDLPDGTITPYAGWNPGVVIVDPWSGAMGYHVISTPANYPKKLKILIEHKLTQYYDTARG